MNNYTEQYATTVNKYFDSSSIPNYLIEQLQEINSPFIHLPDNKKWQNGVDHTNSANQYPARLINGNYGVMPIGKLGFLDIDVPPEDLPQKVKRFLSRYQSFQVKSIHGGIHVYYFIEGDIANSTEEWGSIRVNNQYVVGPGSKVDHAYCDDCNKTGVDSYRTYRQWDIGTVPADEVEELCTRPDSLENLEVNPTFDDSRNNRLAFATNRDKKFNQLWEWACGRGSLNGLEYKDKSRPEVALAQKILFYFEWDIDILKEIFAEIKPPKWDKRGKNYRQSVIQYALNYTAGKDAKFNPNYHPEGRISGVSKVEAIQCVADIESLKDLSEGFRTVELEAISKGDVRISQKKKVLRKLKESNYLGYVDKGRNGGYWSIEDLPAADSDFWDQFKTDDQIRQIRYNYLKNQI